MNLPPGFEPAGFLYFHFFRPEHQQPALLFPPELYKIDPDK